jgi:3-oxoacyl-[acyl-carrier protein] reductase
MSNKIALVFGGTRGIGAACVHKLAESGYDVAYTYVSSAPNLPATIGSARTRGYAVDIREPAQVAQVFADVARDFGSAPNCVVANAGINVPPGPMAQFDPESFRKLVEVNIVGAFNVLSAAAKNVVDGGTVIALTTSMVRLAVPGGGPYTATKAAVEGMVRSMSKELAPRKVRVNAVAPGPVDTDLFRAGKTDEAKARAAGMSPFNRIGTPDEVAEVVSFLASEKASWVHGQVIQPNGGMV